MSFPSRTAAGCPDPGASLVAPTASRAVTRRAGRRGSEPDHSPQGGMGHSALPLGWAGALGEIQFLGEEPDQRGEDTGMPPSVCSRARAE